MDKIILASSSPRRKNILEDMGLDFVIIPSAYEEIIENPDFSYEKIETLAYKKAKKVAEDNPDLKTEKILSADTVVVCDNKILCKPKDKKQAFEMLQQLNDKTHFVVTAICILDLAANNKILKSTTSYVTFNKLEDWQITDYIEKFNPLDKAGAYGIQELPNYFIKDIKGSFKNIMGLCPDAVRDCLGLK